MGIVALSTGGLAPLLHGCWRYSTFAARWTVVLCLALLFLFVAAWASADTAELETDVKAAMLYKFLGYIEWPAAAFDSPESPYVIAILKADEIADELRRLTQERTVGARSIKVLEVDAPGDITNAHLVFIGRDARVNKSRLDRIASDHAVATVTENQRGLEKVSVINLRVINGRVGFDVSLYASEKRNLKLSARMLSVAATVEKEPR